MPEAASIQPAQHVGLLVVHGIGQQVRFETAAALARSLGGTLGARELARALAGGGAATFDVIDRTADREAAELDCPSPNPSDSPYEILVQNADGSQTHVHIHEVWWADLGDPNTLAEQFGFWVWALGQWGARIDRVAHFAHGESNTNLLMVGPKFQEQGSTADYAPEFRILEARALLFVWAVAAFLTYFSWNVVKQVLSWISSYIGSSSLITDYVGHVRIYTQTPPLGGGSLVDVGQPWRATIRRRMNVELVAMAERGYDRWYLLAHSQGAVLAFNAVQETEWVLPNYLQPAQADRLRRTPLWTRAPYLPPTPHGDRPNLDLMMPRRPVWLGDHEGVSRTHLFQNFCGLLTYGAPLDKYATLWPRIVSLNKQRDVFPPGADWVNLWDAADPIGANLIAFSDKDSASPKDGPVNVRVRVNPIFLYAHICYLRARAADARADTDALLNVVLPAAGAAPGLAPAFKALPGSNDPQTLRRALGYLQAFFGLVLLALGAGLLAFMAKGLVNAAFAQAPKAIKAVWVGAGAAVANVFGDDYPGAVAFVVALALIIVLGCGLWRRFREAKPGAAPRGEETYPRVS